jgi:XTP/dITP diphosphohydrolase
VLDLLFATTNPGKLRELRRLVEGMPVRVVSPADLGRPLPEVEEDGATFQANAEKKARACARAAGLHALADDSGLCVDALWGMPGIRSARWSEPEAPGLSGLERDRANNRKLLLALRGVPPEIRGAEYRAVLALAAPDGRVVAAVSGSCRGRIAEGARGEGGFGYDPLFVPEAELHREGHRPRTMAELPPAEKDALSHRGDAFRKMLPLLRQAAANV